MSYLRIKDVTGIPHRVTIGKTVLLSHPGVEPLLAATLVALTKTHAVVRTPTVILTVPFCHLQAPTHTNDGVFDIGDHVVLTQRSARVLPSVGSTGVVLACDPRTACVSFTMEHDCDGLPCDPPIGITQNAIPLDHLALHRGYDVVGDVFVQEEEPATPAVQGDTMDVLKTVLSPPHLHAVLLRYNLTQLRRLAKWLSRQPSVDPDSASLTELETLLHNFEALHETHRQSSPPQKARRGVES